MKAELQADEYVHLYPESIAEKMALELMNRRTGEQTGIGVVLPFPIIIHGSEICPT